MCNVVYIENYEMAITMANMTMAAAPASSGSNDGNEQAWLMT